MKIIKRNDMEMLDIKIARSKRIPLMKRKICEEIMVEIFTK